MKRKIYMFAAAVAIVLAACTDDEVVDQGVPVETGDEIMFGSMLNGDHNAVDVNNPGSRTYYGERKESGIPIYWEKNDTIAIFCPQASAPNDHLVNYVITPNKENPAQSGTMVKVDKEEVGLQWGTGEIHKFFGVYPASVIKATDSDDQHGTITASLPSTQHPIGWQERDVQYPGVIGTKKVLYGIPNMNYSLMLAYSSINKNEITKDKPISLQFQNLVTVLDIVVQGPEKGSATITNVNVEVISGEDIHICGDFDVQIDKLDENKFVCEPKDNGKVTNLISIPCYNAETQEFITLQAGEVMVLKAFIIPATTESEYFRQFRITVASLNGSANRMSLSKIAQQQQQITPRKINRILLPKVDLAKPVAWMANLDPNIYLTELSIPGSKMSYATDIISPNKYFQKKTIEEQFEDGVRAFIVQTGADCSYSFHDNSGASNDSFEFKDCTNMKEEYTDNDLSETLKSLQKALKNDIQSDPVTGKTNESKECAVLVLTYSGGSKVNVRYTGEEPGLFDAKLNLERAWIESVENYITKMAKTYPIYTKPITPETTLGDVAGQIIVKVNYNNTDQEKYVDTETPALFAIWKKPVSEDLAPTSDLYWGKISGNNSAKMYWLCQEATHVGGGKNDEITVDYKKEAIQQLFDKALTQYTENTNHNEWYMNDLGGIYTANNSTKDLAKDMNALAVDKLQKRKENASTGLVFMNFADRAVGSGADCKSDYLLATIIDNNFKFALRKRGTTSGSN